MPRKRTRKPDVAKQNAHARQQQRYTREEKLRAVTIMVGMGGMTYEAIEQIRLVLKRNVSKDTLSHWQTQFRDEVISIQPQLAPKELDVPKIIAETRQKLLVNLSAAAEKYSDHLTSQDVIDKASARDSAVVVGISTEKLLLVAGRTPELDNLLQSFIKECEGTTFNPQSLLESLVNAVKAKKQALLTESSDIIDGEIITEQIS